MAKLIITIEEKAWPIENNKTMVAFGITQDMVWEDADKSLLPSMGPILTELVLKVISLIQQHTGGTLHKADICDRSIPLESQMAELKANLAQPFPSEL